MEHSPHALQLLEKVFQEDKFPSVETRRTLAGDLKVTPRQVQVWFQNKRQRSVKPLIKAAERRMLHTSVRPPSLSPLASHPYDPPAAARPPAPPAPAGESPAGRATTGPHISRQPSRQALTPLPSLPGRHQGGADELQQHANSSVDPTMPQLEVFANDDPLAHTCSHDALVKRRRLTRQHPRDGGRGAGPGCVRRAAAATGMGRAGRRRDAAAAAAARFGGDALIVAVDHAAGW